MVQLNRRALAAHAGMCVVQMLARRQAKIEFKIGYTAPFMSL
jgi:hypothetical protein